MTFKLIRNTQMQFQRNNFFQKLLTILFSLNLRILFKFKLYLSKLWPKQLIVYKYKKYEKLYYIS